MDDQPTVTLTSNGYGAQTYLPRSLFEHSQSELEPGDEAVPEVLPDGRIALRPVDDHDRSRRPPVDGNTTGTRRDHDGTTTGDGDGGGIGR